MAAAHHVLGTIQIPRGMIWVDEFTWSAVVKSTERSITGALIIDAAPLIAGRPITLQGEESQGWIRRTALLALQELANAPGETYELHMADGRTFSVQFAADEPLSAKPIARPELPADTHPYVATLRLITI